MEMLRQVYVVFALVWPIPYPRDSPDLCRTLKGISLAADMSVETDWICAAPVPFKQEMEWHRPYIRCALSYPPSGDADRFRVSHTVVNQALDLSNAYLAHLGNVRSLNDSGWYTDREGMYELLKKVEGQVGHSRYVWGTLQAMQASPSTMGRRRYLDTLRKLLGDDTYYRGVLPPALPMEYLREVE